MKKDIELGITLYSLTFDYITGKLNLEGCLKRAKEMGYKGIEIVASMMMPEYPWPSDEWIKKFRDLVAKYELEPVCYSAYVDMGLRSDRDLNEDEIIQFTINDMIAAKKMGFPIVRSQYSMSAAVMEKMIPYAKKLGIKLCVELHFPHNPEVPLWKDFLDLMEQKGEGWLGVVPDMGIFQEKPHALYLRQARDMGFREEKLQQVLKMHSDGEKIDDVLQIGLTDTEKGIVKEMFGTFHPANLSYLDRLVANAPYIHGKFYYIDENCRDNCIPYHKILPYIQKLGFKGYIASEYEGHHFYDDVNPTEQLSRFVKMCNRELGYEK